MKLAWLLVSLAGGVIAAGQAAFDFPFPPPLPGARLIETKQINEPLELKQATAEEEAVIAGQSYIQQTYARPNQITAIVFVHGFRDALFTAGWKLIDVTSLEAIPIQPETVNVAAHYRNGPQRLCARDAGAGRTVSRQHRRHRRRRLASPTRA